MTTRYVVSSRATWPEYYDFPLEAAWRLAHLEKYLGGYNRPDYRLGISIHNIEDVL